MNVLLLHAYSRANRGDGILVDLADSWVRAAGATSITTCAVWPDTFNDLPDHTLLAAPNNTATAIRDQITAITGRHPLQNEIDTADLIVGVGGGYLRAGHTRETVRTWAAHHSQLHQAMKAAESGKRVVYLPQSVGPFNGPVGKHLNRDVNRLARHATFFMRDDRSISDTGSGTRAPDSALCWLGHTAPTLRAQPGGKVAVVIRDLHDMDRTFETNIRDLLNRFGDRAVVAVGSDAGSSNNDRTIIRRVTGQTDPATLGELLEHPEELGAVLSMRLHGALGSWMEGVPAVHLSYERKGWAAYQDLGVQSLVDDARTFNPAKVAEVTEAVAADPGRWWEQAAGTFDTLAGWWDRIGNELTR